MVLLLETQLSLDTRTYSPYFILSNFINFGTLGNWLSGDSCRFDGYILDISSLSVNDYLPLI